MKKVSIIVPVFNSEKYIESCIRSIMTQTYSNWELLLVNDGSTDGCVQICQEFADIDDRIIFISQENRGVCAARNVGIENATGQYITFVDSDDELEPEAISILLDGMEKYNADIVSASKNKIYEDGRTRCLNNSEDVEISTGLEMIKRSLLYDAHTHGLHGKLFARKLIEDIRFVEGHNINEDGYFLFLCYAKQPKSVHHNISVYRYFVRANSASLSKFSEKYFDMLYYCNLKLHYIEEHIPEFVEYAKDMEVRTHLLFLDVLCRDKKSLYEKDAKKSIAIVRKRFLKFRPISRHEKILMAIVVLGLYPVYRWLFHIKYPTN